MSYILTPKTMRLFNRLAKGVVNQVVLTGYPGTGKTAFTEFFAGKQEAQYLYTLCHPWVTEEDFFNTLDIGAVAVGVQEKNDAWLPGVLRLATEASLRGKVVLCLDEIDKVNTRVEVLLLDFLQTGRVPLPDHTLIRGNPENLTVFLTSNGQRPLTDALLRRLYRFEMVFLPAKDELEILRVRTGAPTPVIKNVLQLATRLREGELTSKPSLPELERLITCLRCDECTLESVRDDVVGTIIKSEEDLPVLDKTGNWAAMLYSNVKRSA